ncbi:MAG TPA: dienelactone hydrolase family protein [Woeseiaceae bacterium]|nr:dienelactone hydrolase family protein [Woeseiaceae bacterium]
MAPAGAAAAGRAPPAASESGSAAPPAEDRPVDAETLPYADVEEQLAYGYFAFPSDMVEPLPAILLVHDWWGLDDDMRAAANRLAASGYIVLAVDLYGGETAADAGAAREKTIAVFENTDAVAENIRQAIDFVEVAGAPAVAIIGWGFGGGFALDTALEHPDRIDAVVVFYGQVPGSADRLATLDAPVLGLFGGADSSITRESVEAFGAATHRLGKPADIEIYADAGQGFADVRRRAYDAALAARAWQRMLEFLATHLVAGVHTDEAP